LFTLNVGFLSPEVDVLIPAKFAHQLLDLHAGHSWSQLAATFGCLVLSTLRRWHFEERLFGRGPQAAMRGVRRSKWRRRRRRKEKGT
jgi:hypothetical protein